MTFSEFHEFYAVYVRHFSFASFKFFKHGWNDFRKDIWLESLLHAPLHSSKFILFYELDFQNYENIMYSRFKYRYHIAMTSCDAEMTFLRFFVKNNARSIYILYYIIIYGAASKIIKYRRPSAMLHCRYSLKPPMWFWINSITYFFSFLSKVEGCPRLNQNVNKRAMVLFSNQ